MISLCLTNYNRTNLLFESIAQVINDERISEVVISDDHSDINIYNQVIEHYKGNDKVKIYRNHENLDCYKNKRQAVKKSTNEWVILFDSDNIMTKSYIDAIDGKVWDANIILQPSFARPHFDFRKYSGMVVTRHNVKQVIGEGNFQTMLNAMNYFVNRDQFLRVWEYSQPMLKQLGGDPVTSDSLYQNYAWLASGNSINVVAGLEYDHRVHSGSHYQNNVKRTPQRFHETILDKLKQL